MKRKTAYRVAMYSMFGLLCWSQVGFIGSLLLYVPFYVGEQIVLSKVIK